MDDQQQQEIIEEPDYTVTLSEREKTIRNKFVQEYLIDYDSTAAAIRLGYPKSVSKEYGVRFMNEPYVLQQIRSLETTPGQEEDSGVMKKRIMTMLLKEANYRGPGCSQSARVAALAKLASIHNMDAPIRSQTEILNPNGLAGVFLVPGIMTPEQWEAAAAAQQEALVNGTVKPVHEVPVG